MKTPTLTLHSPLDMHLHLREGEMLKLVTPHSAESFAGAVVMPNLVPPLDSLDRLIQYRQAITEYARPDFQPFMTVFFRPYSREELESLKPQVLGIKLYPKGATTNSEAGMADIAQATSTLKTMEDLDIPLLVHGEDPSAFVMDREKAFYKTFEHLVKGYPKLRVVMEHITTAGALKLLDRHENLFATVTLHHLAITLDDVAGGLLRPHLFCKPIAKRPEDRDALLQAALSAHPKLSFGSDSAPHPIHAKECCGCAAGIFSAPVALPALASLFEAHDSLDHLQAFVSDQARSIYGVSPAEKIVVLEKRPWKVPGNFGEVIPYLAGETLPWSLSSVSPRS